ncbi:hypothetical protein NL676_005653 [Syzygium grande]|nr:hypothetical protein NL676_005653 [Syzygium grande]
MEIKTLPLGEAIKTQKRIRPLSCGYRAGIARAPAEKPEAVKIPCRGAWTCTREEPPNPLLSTHEQFRRRGEGRRRSNGQTGGGGVEGRRFLHYTEVGQVVRRGALNEFEIEETEH